MVAAAVHRGVVVACVVALCGCEYPREPGWGYRGGADVPAADVAVADVPVADALVADVPVADVPVADVPVADVAWQDVVVADVPVADVPVADVLVADVPVADVPVADVPVADVPVADVPPADVPPADVPPADVPVADVPVADVPPADVPLSSTTQRSCTGTPQPAGCGLVGVAGGTFTMGAPSNCSGPPDPTCAYDAAPPQTGITVGNFAIDAYEVSVDRFRVFWAARSTTASPSVLRISPIPYRGTTIGWGLAAQDPLPLDADCNWSMSDASVTAHPMNCVDWWLAQEFCVWDGGRLPTEAEWEFAARGRSVGALAPGRLFPWGDTSPSYACDRAHWNACPGTDGRPTRHVDAFAASEGIFGLAGSVWEWTADNWGAYPSCRMSSNNPLCNNSAVGNRVIRGGSWSLTFAAGLRSASRYYYTVRSRFHEVGFRCARDTP